MRGTEGKGKQPEREKMRVVMIRERERDSACVNQRCTAHFITSIGLLTHVCARVCVKELHKQLDEVTQDAEIIAIRQKEAECELEATRDRVQQQATEILLKASETSSFIYLH